MARTTTTAQDERLGALHRETHVRIRYEDPDGVMQDIGDLSEEDFFDAATIEANADQPISRATFEFWRSVGDKSLAPLIEASEINRDSGGSYAPALNPVREIDVAVAMMFPGETPGASDYVTIWEGLIDDLDWARERIVVNCRDPMATLNDTIISAISTYGDDGGSKNIDDVMQDVLDAEFGSSTWPLTVVGTPTLAIAEYELGNVSVLEALMALADLIGWSLRWKWDSGNSEFRLTFYEPDRTNTTASFTFGPDDYYVINRVALGVQGIRNVGEVLYTDSNGAQQVASDTRSTSVATYGERFIRVDAQGSSIVNSTQADAFLEAILDDTEDPKIRQEIEAAFHWPIEVGDVHDYSANDEHYDTTQTWAAFGYRHIIEPRRMRTVIQAAGKPSGGFARWLAREAISPPAAPAIQLVGHRIRSTGGTTSGGEGDQQFERDALFIPNDTCLSVEVSYSFVRPIKTSAQPPTSTTFNVDYGHDITVDPGDTEVHTLEDGLGSVFTFIAQDNAGATIRDSNFFLTLIPYSATGGASGTGVAGAPVVIQVDQIGENDDVGVRVTTADDQDIPGMRLRTPSGAGVKSEWNASDGEIDLSLDALYVTESVDFGAMGSEGAQSAIGVTVTGAEVGDPVFACPAEEVTEAISVLAYVASADTVTLRAVNVTGSSVNPGATDWNIVVLKL